MKQHYQLDKIIYYADQIPYKDRNHYDFLWEFSDHTKSTGYSTKHIWHELGTKDVKLTVTNKSNGLKNVFSNSVNIVPGLKGFVFSFYSFDFYSILDRFVIFYVNLENFNSDILNIVVTAIETPKIFQNINSINYFAIANISIESI